MKAVKVFVSFDIENDEVEMELFKGMVFKSRMPLVVAAWSARSTMKPERWERIVKEKINECQIFIVLSGKRMAVASNVSTEIAMARELSVPVFGIYVNQAGRGSPLPKGLALSRTMAWDWRRIDEAIKLGLREGKNKILLRKKIANRS